jgi:hypothetical protein
VLLSLPAFIEATLKLAHLRGYDEPSNISLAGSHDHIRHVVLVSRGIKNGESFIFCAEESFTAFDSFPFFSDFNLLKQY